MYDSQGCACVFPEAGYYLYSFLGVLSPSNFAQEPKLPVSEPTHCLLSTPTAVMLFAHLAIVFKRMGCGAIQCEYSEIKERVDS